MDDANVQRKVDQLARELDEGAVALVRDYIELDAEGRPRYTGSQFELLDGGRDAGATADRFTPGDLVSLALLGVAVGGWAALELLDDRSARWSSLLGEISPTDDPSTCPQQLADPTSAAHRLWSNINALPTMGPTRTGKLLARKRPKLLPVYDSVVEAAIIPADGWWQIIATFFADPDRVAALDHVRRRAGAEHALSPLRTLDVVLWMRHRGPIEG